VVQRTRTLTVQTVVGKRELYNAANTLIISTTNSSVSAYEKCIDDVIVGDNGNFKTYKQGEFQPLVVNGQSTGAGKSVFTDFCPQGLNNLHMLDPNDILPALTNDKGDSVYTTQLLKRTNPSRPYVDLPVFIAELKDIPDLLIKLGRPLRTIAQANLAYQFGWKPLLSDLAKMLNFQDIVHARYLELKRLYKNGIRRTVNLDSCSGEYETNVDWAGPGTTRFIGKCKQTRSTLITGHVKWKPLGFGPVTDKAMLELARRSVLGLTLDFATFWELIPWSWLVDWFSNVGDFLIANRNLVPAVPYDTCIMRNTKVTGLTDWSTKTNPYSLTVEAPRGNWAGKSRKPTSASLSTDLEWLSLRQLSILGSLYVVKTRRR
jgi:hypothetical protein